jgi:hypothetical protein
VQENPINLAVKMRSIEFQYTPAASSCYPTIFLNLSGCRPTRASHVGDEGSCSPIASVHIWLGLCRIPKNHEGLSKIECPKSMG